MIYKNESHIAGDFDGDGLADPTVYGLTSGYWFIMASSYGYITIVPVW